MEWRVEVGERVIWKSGTGVSWDCDLGVLRVACVESGGVGDTTISRHCRVGLSVPFVRDDVDVDAGEAVGFGVWEGGTLTTWKAWMGSASKNSCATMKGILVWPGLG